MDNAGPYTHRCLQHKISVLKINHKNVSVVVKSWSSWHIYSSGWSHNTIASVLRTQLGRIWKKSSSNHRTKVPRQYFVHIFHGTARCRYNTVQYQDIAYSTAVTEAKIKQSLSTHGLWAVAVSVIRNLEKTDSVITARFYEVVVVPMVYLSILHRGCQQAGPYAEGSHSSRYPGRSCRYLGLHRCQYRYGGPGIRSHLKWTEQGMGAGLHIDSPAKG